MEGRNNITQLSAAGGLKSDLPTKVDYATIHRIAGNGKVHGVLHAAVEFALQRYNNIRIDTNSNKQ